MKESLKKNRGLTNIAIAVIIIAIILLVTIVCMIVKNKLDNKNEINYSNESEIGFLSEDDFGKWNGTYKNGDTTIILYDTIYSNNTEGDKNYNNAIGVTIISGGSYNDFSIRKGNTSQLLYDSVSFGEETKFRIVKKKSGIEIVDFFSSSVEEQNISGSYQKTDYTNLKWDGIYLKDDMTICLSQLSDTTLNCCILCNYSEVQYIFSDITAEKLNIQESDGNKLIISKENDNIVIDSGANDADSVLKLINGNKFKKHTK